MAQCFIDEEQIEPERIIPAKTKTTITLELTPREACLIRKLAGNIGLSDGDETGIGIYRALAGVPGWVDNPPLTRPITKAIQFSEYGWPRLVFDYYNGGES